MERKIIGLLICTLGSLISVAQKEQDCNLFRYGKFKLIGVERMGYQSYIERTEKARGKQIEYIKGKNVNGYYSYDLIWLDDCHYSIILRSTNVPRTPGLIRIGDTIDIRIDRLLSHTSAVMTTYYNGEVLTDTMVKIK